MKKTELRAIAEAIREATKERDESPNPAVGQYRDGFVDGMKMAVKVARRSR